VDEQQKDEPGFWYYYIVDGGVLAKEREMEMNLEDECFSGISNFLLAIFGL
jgi:hypothetical protein